MLVVLQDSGPGEKDLGETRSTGKTEDGIGCKSRISSNTAVTALHTTI